ncbi:hypothetical protein [Aliamphritea hakodatensis]|uniref:hypothetical protein n=1 Tax=Aliamphritea hakodatensis TaxID=2895352 RepID=UPI0022FD589A|nr:hypothetical protein [Aliamphritea hakodatensis]
MTSLKNEEKTAQNMQQRHTPEQTLKTTALLKILSAFNQLFCFIHPLKKAQKAP